MSHPFMCYIEEGGTIHGTICSQYIEHGWYSDLGSRNIKLIFEINNVSMRYLAFAISSDNVNWEVLHVQDSQNNVDANVTIPSTYDGAVKFGIKLYDTPPTVGSVLNVGFDYVITGGIDLSVTNANKKVAMQCPTGGAVIKYTLDGTEPIENSTDYIEEIEVTPPVTIKARGFKDNLLSSDIAELSIVATIPLDTPVLKIGQKSSLENAWYVMLDNISNYPDNAVVHYSHTSGNEEGNMTISDIKNGVGGVAGAIALVSLVMATLFVSVSCAGYVDSPSEDITLQELPTPSCSYSRISSSQGRVTISNYSSYPSGTKFVINNTEYEPASYINLSIGTSATNVTVYATYDGDEPYMTESTRVSGTIPQYVAPTPTCATPTISFSSSTNRVTITCSTSGATIYYRVGSSGSYSVYSGSFTISSSTYVYAYATRSGYNTSGTASKYCTYTDPTPSLPTPSMSGSVAYEDGRGYVMTVRLTNYSSFPSGTTFSVTCTWADESTSNHAFSSYNHSFRVGSIGGMNPVPVKVKCVATCSGYDSSSSTITVNM